MVPPAHNCHFGFPNGSFAGANFLTGFEHTRSWLADVREHADPHLTCILVGNKIDLCAEEGSASSGPGFGSGAGPAKRVREVPTEEAERWAKEEGLLFVEASARSGENVEDAFEKATRDILDKIRRGVFDDDRVSRVVQMCHSPACSAGTLSAPSFPLRLSPFPSF